MTRVRASRLRHSLQLARAVRSLAGIGIALGTIGGCITAVRGHAFSLAFVFVVMASVWVWDIAAQKVRALAFERDTRYRSSLRLTVESGAVRLLSDDELARGRWIA